MESLSQQPTTRRCIVCGNDKISSLIAIEKVPIHCNLLWPTRDAALQAPQGHIELGFCENCGHIFNLAFDPGFMVYTQDYENSLHFSPRFRQYAHGLATRLVEQYDLHDKDIVEIGSGQGDFLNMLCDMGHNRGVGFDPSYVDEGAGNQGRVHFVRDFYSEAYSDYPADFICSRHVLEHIHQPSDFMSMVRQVVGQRHHIVAFIEVPNVQFTVRQLGIWDIIYEHPSYFSSSSLATVLALSGFRVLEMKETFGSQFLTAEALPAGGAPKLPSVDTVVRLAQDVTVFADKYREKVETWQQYLEEYARQGRRAVVWGAGSKGVTFLNTVKSSNVVQYAVDINPRKKGMHVTGTGQEIVPPEFLPRVQPDVVIIMNANYKDEIGGQLEAVGVSADIVLA
jgi:hypothetical protein